MEDLKDRIGSTNLRVIIVVPNMELKDRYSDLGVNVVVATIDSFRKLLSEPEKNSIA